MSFGLCRLFAMLRFPVRVASFIYHVQNFGSNYRCYVFTCIRTCPASGLKNIRTISFRKIPSLKMNKATQTENISTTLPDDPAATEGSLGPAWPAGAFCAKGEDEHGKMCLWIIDPDTYLIIGIAYPTSRMTRSQWEKPDFNKMVIYQ
nr:hypothetical protein [Cressdnaviricota sp.]